MGMSRPEKLSHYAVVLIAISAVVVSVWQVKLGQRHNKLSVRPYFNITRGTTTTNREQIFNLSISNEGVGPGIIKSFELYVDGQRVPHWNAVVHALGDSVIMTSASTFDIDDVFAAGGQQPLLTLHNYKSEGRVRIRVIYESIYEESFPEEDTF